MTKGEEIQQREEIRWYALRALHNKGSAVCRIATSDGIEWYTPLRETEEIVDGRPTTRTTPLMPSLIFLRCTTTYIEHLRRITGDNIIPYCYAHSIVPEPIYTNIIHNIFLTVKAFSFLKLIYVVTHSPVEFLMIQNY